MAKKEMLTTMKQESIKKGLTKPMSSKRPKSWKGGSVAENQNKPKRQSWEIAKALGREASKLTGHSFMDPKTGRAGRDLKKTRKGK